MATIYLSGKGMWMHRLFEIDDFKGRKFWSMNLYPDPKSLKALKEGNFLLKIRRNDEGEYAVFRRYLLKPWKLKADEPATFDPPVVLDSEGEPWPAARIIGNGSEVTVKLEMFPSGNDGFGTRLEGLKVNYWVEYKAPEEEAGEANDDTIRPF